VPRLSGREQPGRAASQVYHVGCDTHAVVAPRDKRKGEWF
jgi:hypothetical protein